MYCINLFNSICPIDIFADSFDLLTDYLGNPTIYFYQSHHLVCSFPAVLVRIIWQSVDDDLVSVFETHVTEGAAI